MDEELLAPEIRDFITECIKSVAQLEALILLRDAPEHDWTVSDLAQRLYIEELEARAILSSLVECELARTDGEVFRYFALNSERQSLVDNVAYTYSQFLVPVTKFIHNRAIGAQKFADAFRFRRDK